MGALAGQPALGCVLPPDLEPEAADAGPSSPPIILSAGDPFAFPGPISIDREGGQTMSLVAVDNDLGDSLYLRLYRDYERDGNGATPSLVDCRGGAGPSLTRERNFSCSTDALCFGVGEQDDSLKVLEAMVADQAFILDSLPEAVGQPEFRALANPGRAAFSLRAWSMQCETPP